MSQITAKVIADSITPTSERLTTLQLRYPRFIHCFHEDTEFLSQINDEFPEWRSYDAIVKLGAKVAQYEEGNLSFVQPLGAIKKPSKKLVVHSRKTFEMAVTPEHRMYSLRRTTNNQFLPHVDTAQEWVGSFTAQRRIPQAGNLKTRSDSYTPDEYALIAFYVADGHRPNTGNMSQFHFRKQRKVERVVELLGRVGIRHEVSNYGEDTVIRFDPPAWVEDCYTEKGEKKFPDDIWSMSSKSFEAFKAAVLEADGSVQNREINTTSPNLASQIQILAALNNEAMNIRSYDPLDGRKKLYKQKFLESPYVSFRSDKNHFEEVDYEGDVVCFSVPSSFLFVRYKGFAFVSGNCEFMTHRVFTRNASSSRAIPVKRMLAQVWKDPAMPVSWGRNQAGMQAGRPLMGWRKKLASTLWRGSGKFACIFAWGLMKLSLHKEVANRILEPWQFINVVVTATDWENFFILRDHPNAQPEIRRLAEYMKVVMDMSEPALLDVGDFHLPYVRPEEIERYKGTENEWLLPVLSSARCARVSYNRHDGTTPSVKEDKKLFERLVISEPAHASPCEHQAQYVPHLTGSRNFRGPWYQFRAILEHTGWGPYSSTGVTVEL